MTAVLTPQQTQNAPDKQAVEAPTQVVGRPPNFPRLQRFFGSQTALATALGVHRDTIRKWGRGEASRLRRTSIERVYVMSAVAEQVARFMPTDASVGAWLLQPQPALGGDIPAYLIRRDGRKAYERILQKAAAIAEPVSVGNFDVLPAEDELLAAMSQERADNSVERAAMQPGAEDSDEDPDFLASLGSADTVGPA
jgi:hypothetical protein